MFGMPAAGAAQPADSVTTLRFGAYVDAYYAYDFARPPGFDRAFAGGAPFTTQPARHNEFNVNLAFLEASLSSEELRGRIALQAGTSVQANSSGEPAVGVTSGPLLSRHIQEAVAGVRLLRTLWVDAGVYFSHLGMESWISRDNLTYTRSLVAELAPYYQSGVKFTWSPRRWVAAQLHVVNGWQNISENNSGKGVGLRLDLKPAPRVMLSGYNLLSQESGRRLRAIHGFGATVATGRLEGLIQADLGMQENSAANGRPAHWYGYSIIGRAQLARSVSASIRFERFDDDEQIVVATGAIAGVPNAPFRGYGESVGIDVKPARGAVWRTELRAFQNSGRSFPDGNALSAVHSNAFAVTSLALSF